MAPRFKQIHVHQAFVGAPTTIRTCLLLITLMDTAARSINRRSRVASCPLPLPATERVAAAGAD